MASVNDVRSALRWGAWVFGGVTLLVFYRSYALDTAVRFGHPGIQRAAYGITIGAWLVSVCLLVFRLRTRVRLAFVAGLSAVSLGAAAAATFTVPASQQSTGASWAVASSGWILLAVGSGGRFGRVLLLLAVPQVFALAAAVPGGAQEIVLMTARIVGILGLQVPVALAAQAIQRSADAAAAVRLEQDAIRTDRLVADTLHDDRLRRSRSVAVVVEPVLAALAEPDTGTDPDETVRRRCAVAAARMRRLLAEWHHDGPDPLGADLIDCLDAAQVAGVQVTVAVHTRVPLPAALRRAACDVVGTVAPGPGVRLRLTALSTATHASLGIVVRGVSAAALPDAPSSMAARTTSVGDSLWVELECPL